MVNKEIAIKLTDLKPQPQMPVVGDSVLFTLPQFEAFLDQGGVVRNELVYRVHFGDFDAPTPSTQPLINGRESILYRFGS